MPPKIGLSGHAFSAQAPHAFLRTLTAEFGLRHLDFWPANQGELSLGEYGRLLERHGVQVYSVNVPGSRGRLGGSEGSEAAPGVLEGIATAQQLGAAFVQFYIAPPTDPATAVAVLAEQLAPLLEAAARAGVTLTFENNLDQKGEDPYARNVARLPETCLALLQAVDSPHLRFNLDPTNFLTVGQEGFPYAYERLRPHLAGVHVKDAVRYSAQVYPDAVPRQKLLTDAIGGSFLPVAAGEGAVNWDGLLRRLRADGFAGWLTLDPFSNADLLPDICRRSLERIHSQE